MTKLSSESPAKRGAVEPGAARSVDGVGVVVGALLLVVAALCTVARARTLAYPYPWGSEGLTLDYARRALLSWVALYPPDGRVTPFPLVYTPLLTWLLAALAQWPEQLMLTARLLSTLWTVALLTGVFLLVRRIAGGLMGLVAGGLLLANGIWLSWILDLRVDGLMLTLWLWAATWLLPATLGRGADSLGWRRLLLGAAALLLAVLAKPTAVVHGAPLVLVWWWVDRRSALRLALVVGGGGLLLLAALQAATDGGFWLAMRSWGYHGQQWTNYYRIPQYFVISHAPLMLWAVAPLAWARRAGRPKTRDTALVLVLGGLCALPLLGKLGAFHQYMLPLLVAVVVLGGRAWQHADRRLGAVLGALLALATALAKPMPTPTQEDRRTADFFFGLVSAVAAQSGQPVLAFRPNYAYHVAGQATEIEGTSFEFSLLREQAGARDVVERIATGRYGMIVTQHEILSRMPEVLETVQRGYRYLGSCALGYMHSQMLFHLYVHRGARVSVSPPVGSRCQIGGHPPPPYDQAPAEQDQRHRP